MKSCTIKGDTMLKLIYATKCSNNLMHPQIHSQDSLQLAITLVVLRSVALSHLKRGTAALEPWHCHDLSDRWGLGGIYTLPLPPRWLSASSSSLQLIQNRKEPLSLSPSIVDLEPSSKSIDFPINP